MHTNSDFDKLVNAMNDITNQENKVELEGFYTLHSTTFQFFKAIDKTVQDVLSKPNIGIVVLEQLKTNLPILVKLKNEIFKIDTESIAVNFKTKINQSIAYINNNMTLSEVNNIAQEFFDLLEENKATLLTQNNEKEKEERNRKAKKRKPTSREQLLAIAAQGNAEAQYQVGMNILLKGKEVIFGLEWLEKAAKQDHDNALSYLGCIYLLGYFGVPKNKNKSLEYYKRSARLGNESSAQIVKNNSAQIVNESTVQKAKEKIGESVNSNSSEHLSWILPLIIFIITTIIFYLMSH